MSNSLKQKAKVPTKKTNLKLGITRGEFKLEVWSMYLMFLVVTIIGVLFIGLATLNPNSLLIILIAVFGGLMGGGGILVASIIGVFAFRGERRWIAVLTLVVLLLIIGLYAYYLAHVPRW